MKNLMLGFVLFGAMAASAAATTYVVPVGTAGNSPEAPYDTWATAANDPRTAADATDKDGTVYILGGNYSSYQRITPEQNVHVRIVATQATDGAPGEMTIGEVLAGHSGSAAGDVRLFQVDYGTIKMAPSSSGNAFTEYVSGGAWGARAGERLVLAGEQTTLDTTAATSTYIGYSVRGYDVTVRDGASLLTRYCAVNSQKTAMDLNFMIANGATVTCDGSLDFSNGAITNGVLTVSNATLNVNRSITVGKDGSSSLIRLVTAGERPLMYAGVASSVNGDDCTLIINVSEAPLSGYAERTVGGVATRAAIRVTGSFRVRNGATFELEGVAPLSARLLEERQLTGSWTLIEATGDELLIGAERIAAVNAQLAKEGLGDFTLVQNGKTLLLDYVYTPKTVYVVPGGTAGNTPAFPYDTWDLAANFVKTAAQEVAVGGKVVIASGTYDPNPGSSALWTSFPSQRAIFRAVASESDPSPGKVTLANRGFASGYTNTDYSRYNVTFEYGTFSFALNSANQSFLEYSVSSWGVKSNCRLTVSGEKTVLDQSEATDGFFIGYTTKNAVLHMTDHAQGLFEDLNLGGNANGVGAKLVVDDSATVINSNWLGMGGAAHDVRVIVSNACLQTKTLQIGSDKTKTTNIWLCVVDNGKFSLSASSAPFKYAVEDSGILFDGSTFDQPAVGLNFGNPGTNNTLIVRNGANLNIKTLTMGSAGKNANFVCLVDNAAVSMSGDCLMNGNAKLKLDVSKAAIDGTVPAFLSAASMTVAGDASVELAGAAELESRIEEAKSDGFKVTLLGTKNGLDIPDAVVQAMRAALPEGTSLVRTPNALKLRVGPRKGMVLLVR